jgi:uncharacterized protein (DUF4415 family)
MRAALASLPPITPAQNAILASMAEEQRADVEAAIAAASKAKPAAKQLVAARLDPEVLAWLKGFGDGYSTRINGILRAVMERRFEDALKSGV